MGSSTLPVWGVEELMGIFASAPFNSCSDRNEEPLAEILVQSPGEERMEVSCKNTNETEDGEKRYDESFRLFS